MNNKTAILIFANSAKTEGLNKPLQNATVLFRALNREIETKVKRTKLPYFVVSEKQQKGNAFGERFTNAIQSIFNQGFDNIITVGNDTPQLKVSHINSAYKKLKNNTSVLGPSQDGGFYLMAINKKVFNKKTFLNLPWQTSKLRTEITTLFSKKHTPVLLLESLIDIDSITDAKHIIDSFKGVTTTIKNILLRIITSAKAKIKFTIQCLKLELVASNYNKGSPFIFSI